MSADHPLAGRTTVRLRDCAAYPVALPERSIGGRQLLDEVLRAQRDLRSRSRRNRIHSNCCAAWSLHDQADLVPDRDRHHAGEQPARHRGARIDDRDVPRANLVLGQLRARNLPIPAAIFAERLARELDAMRGDKRATAKSR